MIDDHYLENLSTFSLFSKKELEHQKFINDITLIVEKYNILENENQLIGSTDKTFLYLINFIISLNKKQKTIPEDIKYLFLENLFLKEQIKKYANIEQFSLDAILNDLTSCGFVVKLGNQYGVRMLIKL